MKPRIRFKRAGCALTLALAGTASAQQKEGPDRFASFEMRWLPASQDALAARAQSVAEAMTGQRLNRRATVVAESGTGRFRVTIPDAPQLDIVYLPEYNELRVVDSELAAATSPVNELSQDEALKVAKQFFDQLAARKLIDPRQFNWKAADVASTWVGGGARETKTIERRRTEYRITLRRELNGIEVANAGMRIVVHATGRISGLRLGGVSVASRGPAVTGEEPTAGGRWANRRVSVRDAMARFEREIVPKGATPRIAWSRVMYVMPENGRTAVVEPLYVISYSLEFPSEEGNTVISRRKTIGFSLVDPRAAPIDLTPEVRPPTLESARKR